MSQWLEACSIESFVCWCKVWLRTHVFSLQLHFGLQTPRQKSPEKRKEPFGRVKNSAQFFASQMRRHFQVSLNSCLCTVLFFVARHFTSFSLLTPSSFDQKRMCLDPSKVHKKLSWGGLEFHFQRFESFHAGSEIDWTLSYRSSVLSIG